MECMNVFIASIPNEYERKGHMRIRNRFEQFLGCNPNLISDNIIPV